MAFKMRYQGKSRGFPFKITSEEIIAEATDDKVTADSTTPSVDETIEEMVDAIIEEKTNKS